MNIFRKYLKAAVVDPQEMALRVFVYFMVLRCLWRAFGVLSDVVHWAGRDVNLTFVWVPFEDPTRALVLGPIALALMILVGYRYGIYGRLKGISIGLIRIARKRPAAFLLSTYGILSLFMALVSGFFEATYSAHKILQYLRAIDAPLVIWKVLFLLVR